MDANLVCLLKSIVVVIEVVTAIIAFFTWFRKNEYNSAESFTFAVITTFASYSAFIQLFFLLGIIELFYLVDCIVFILSIWQIRKDRFFLKESIKQVVIFVSQRKMIFSLLFFACAYMFLQVLLLPPSNFDSMAYNLSRILMMDNEGSLFIKNFNIFHQVNFVVGWDILNHLFLRFHSDYFLSIFSFLSYLAIATGTYAFVSNVFRQKELAFIVSIVVLSFTELILQATTTKNDIPTAATTIAVFLAANNVIIRQHPLSLGLLILSLAFGITVKNYYGIFAVIFLIVFTIYYLKVNSIQAAWRTWIPPRRYVLIYFLFLIVLSCFLKFLYENNERFGNAVGDRAFVEENLSADGFQGAAVNAFRYTIQSLEIPRYLGGDWVNRLHNAIIEDPTIATFRDPNVKVDLSSKFVPSEDISWYGPIAFIFVIPSLLYALVRGNYILRLTSISLLAFFIVMCYLLPWTPHRCRYFSLFYGASGLPIAFLIANMSKRAKSLLVPVSILIMYYAILFNESKPIVNVYEIGYYINRNIYCFDADGFKKKRDYDYTWPGPLVLNWFHFASDRNLYNRLQLGKEILDRFSYGIETMSKILIIGDGMVWLFPFLLNRQDLIVTIGGPERILHNDMWLKVNHEKDRKIIMSDFDYILVLSNKYQNFFPDQNAIYERSLGSAKKSLPGRSNVFLYKTAK